MALKLQKRLAADVMRCSPKRITFDPAKAEDIKEAITKTDIRMLVGDGTIKVLPKKGVSRSRANKIRQQKKKGLRKGPGSRKGRATARTPGKESWVLRIRAQREFLSELQAKGIITHAIYKDLYSKASGGMFRSNQHIKIFMAERSLGKKATLPGKETKKQ